MPGNSATEADLRTRGTPVGVEDPEPVAKLPFVLERIHPNPFAAPYEISYSLAGSSRVRLAVYDVQGRVRALIAEARRTGLPGLSLSVELDNPAIGLYERLGFSIVGLDGGAVTMLLSLATG